MTQLLACLVAFCTMCQTVTWWSACGLHQDVLDATRALPLPYMLLVLCNESMSKPPTCVLHTGALAGQQCCRSSQVTPPSRGQQSCLQHGFKQ